MKHKEITVKMSAEFSRLLIGLVFLFSGFVKAIDPMGFEIKIEEYLNVWGLEGFQPLILLIAFNLIAFEFTLGINMLLGVYRRYTTWAVLALMLLMTPLTLYLALFNPVTDCGCFGDALVISNWETFFKNILLLAASVIALVYHRKLLSCYSAKTRWFVPLFAYACCLFFACWNYNHLPLVDFRPYKEGVHIPTQMSIPEGVPEDEYRYSFVYEKDGVRKEFSLDDYPAGDSSWTFVESKTELVKEGYTPPIPAFGVYDLAGNEVGDIILGHSEDLFLLIAARIEETSDKHLDEINNLYDYAEEHEIPFYCLTGSSDREIENRINRTGTEYPFLKADAMLLKTIIRSNPGLLWMNNGTILKKWHHNDLPEEEEINSLLTGGREGVTGKDKRNAWIYVSVFTFALPLLLVWIYDILYSRRRKNYSGMQSEWE
ncbi:MAG: DoxX family protein [Tannerellaceae bacterium]|nr:DoxX family protein [Tannerellaceae bacterium]